jgi:hypothetical protein
MMNLNSIVTLFAFLTILSLVGCSESIDPEILAARERLVLDASPASPLSIAEAKEMAESSASVTLVGRVDAGDFDPFEKDFAAFMLSEVPADHEQGEGHDAENCPFCKRRAANAPKAHVTMVSESDSPIAHSAPKLLGIKKGDQVVVRGNGKWNPELNVLEVKSKQIFLSP